MGIYGIIEMYKGEKKRWGEKTSISNYKSWDITGQAMKRFRFEYRDMLKKMTEILVSNIIDIMTKTPQKKPKKHKHITQ